MGHLRGVDMGQLGKQCSQFLGEPARAWCVLAAAAEWCHVWLWWPCPRTALWTPASGVMWEAWGGSHNGSTGSSEGRCVWSLADRLLTGKQGLWGVIPQPGGTQKCVMLSRPLNPGSEAFSPSCGKDCCCWGSTRASAAPLDSCQQADLSLLWAC